MSIKIALTQFFLIALTYSLCLNLSQPQGQCTECGPLDVLIDGTCYVKIRGCLRHQAGPICIQCQFGYTLSKGTCIRDAVYFNITNTSTIPPVKIDTSAALTYDDIRNRLGQLYGSYFSDAHEYFIGKYSELGKGNVKNVDKLEGRKGVFLVIEYQGDSLNKYIAVAYVDYSTNQVNQWSFEPAGNQRKDPITANNAVVLALGDKLKNFQLYDFNRNGDVYTISYINQNSNLLRVTFNRNDIGSSNFSTKITSKSVTFTAFALEQIFQLYPTYKNLNATDLQKYNGQYVITFGNVASVSFQFINGRFTINKPYDIPATTQISDPMAATNINGILIGGYSLFTNYADSSFIECISVVSKEFPQILDTQVIKVQSQVVAGTNYLINLQKSVVNSTAVDSYEVKIWYTLQRTAKLIEVKKNGIVIYSQNYNYNADTDFLNNYKIVQQNSNVVNIPPIDSVTYKQIEARKYYQVLYSATEYSEFQYFTNSSKANLISYTVDGQNLLKLLSSAQNQSSQRSPDVLLGFLQSKQSIITNRTRIQELITKVPIYTLTVITSSGTYKAIIDDNGGDMKLIQFIQLSNATCFEMKESEVRSSDKINIIDGFLKANYPFSDFNIQLVQVNVQSSSYIYRMLYANSKLKQIEIYLQETNNVANVIKASYINFGYEVVDPISSSQDYAKISAIMKNSTLTGSKVPFFTQVNGSMIKAYYDDGKSTSEIYYDKNTNKASAQVVATRSYLLVPEGFNVSTLLFPGTISSATNITLNRIFQQALKKYSVVLKDAILVFASKQGTNYTLMYKNSYGYQKLEVTIDNSGLLTVGRLIITAYKDNDFSNCQLFNADGKCLSCASDEIQYQGYCWKKLEGCLIQPGGICAKCNINYVKSGQKCYKQCSSFFS